jgi:hypothetical protein
MGALDISELNATENPHTLAQYVDLSAALAAIPTDYQKGGMSIKYVRTSDNKYVQCRLMSDTFNTTPANWQGVDDEPIVGSDNLVKSGGVSAIVLDATKSIVEDKEITDIFAGYINTSGEVSGTSGWHTDYISILGYQKLYLTTRQLQSANILSFYDKNLNYISALSVVGQNYNYTKKEFDISTQDYENAYYVRASSWAQPLSVLLTADNIVSKEDSIIDTLSSLVDKVSEDYRENCSLSGYIRNDGTFDTVGGSHTNMLSVKGYTRVIADVSNLQGGLALAFYNSQQSLISSISVAGNNQLHQIIDIDITAETYRNASYVMVSTWNNIDSYIKLVNSNCIINSQFLFRKSFCALGDSITAGDGNGGVSWFDYLIERYGSAENSINYAVSGQVLRTMADRCTQAVLNNIDYLFVAAGTNQVSQLRIGTINDDATPDKWEANKSYSVGEKVQGGTIEAHGNSDTWTYLYWYECITAGVSGNEENASNFPITDGTTFTDGTVVWKCIGTPSWYSDMKRICNIVWGMNPKINLIWIVPIKNTDDIGKDPSEWSRREVCQAIREFCDYNSIKYVDMRKEFSLTTLTSSTLMYDTLHPKMDGYKLMCNIVSRNIE